LVAAVKAVLEEVQGHGEGFEAELCGEAEFAEAEKVFVEVFGEVAADELLAAVVEGADAVCACVVAEGGSLGCVSDGIPGKLIARGSLTSRSAKCAFILSCTTSSFVVSLSTSSLTYVSRPSRSTPFSCNECNTCSS
jgi:hypothetical protein